MITTTTIHSLSDLRAAYMERYPGTMIAEAKPRKERERKCRICGSVMEHKVGTNVWICHGEIEKPDPTEEDPNRTKKTACSNIVFGY